MADLLVWSDLVAPGTVRNKDRSLTAGWVYEGPDLDSATPSELTAQTEHINRALLPLGDAWAIHCDFLRIPSSAYPTIGAFPDPVTLAIDDERRSHYQATLFESRQILTLTYFPPASSSSWLNRLFITDSAETTDADETALEFFKAQLEEVEGMLGAALRLKRLDDRALLTHLHHSVTGLDHAVEVPKEPYPLDDLLSTEDFFGGIQPRVGSLYLGVLSLSGLPLATSAGMLDAISKLGFRFRFNTRFMPFDPYTAERVLSRLRRSVMQKRKSMSKLVSNALRDPAAPPPQDAAQDHATLGLLRDLDLARAEASGGEIRFGQYTAVLILHHHDERVLAEQLLAAKTLIRNLGVSVRQESVNAIEAFLGSLPGHARPNLRRPIISTRNLAHLLPVTTLWAGRPSNPSPMQPPGSHPALIWTTTDAATPFRFNLHASGDVGHTLVVGPTGSGKSALLALIAAQWFRYPNARVFAFDKNYSFLSLTLAAGGAHYDIASETSGGITFCPLGQIGNPAERSWAVEWCESLFEQSGISLLPETREALSKALSLLANQETPPTLSDLYLKLQDISLRTALSPYTVREQGLAGALLDAQQDRLSTAPFVTFEMARLMEHGPRLVVPTLLYLFRRLHQRLDGSPTLIILDEGWTFLDHPRFSDRIRLWLKELRKLNAVVVFATQSLADFPQSSLRPVLVESTATKIFLPNPLARSESAPLYQALGLNERQLALISGARPKLEYYVTSDDGNRLMRVELGPVGLAFCGAGSQREINAIRNLHREHGSLWPAVWLRNRGLHDAGEALSSQLKGDTPL